MLPGFGNRSTDQSFVQQFVNDNDDVTYCTVGGSPSDDPTCKLLISLPCCLERMQVTCRPTPSPSQYPTVTAIPVSDSRLTMLSPLLLVVSTRARARTHTHTLNQLTPPPPAPPVELGGAEKGDDPDNHRRVHSLRRIGVLLRLGTSCWRELLHHDVYPFVSLVVTPAVPTTSPLPMLRPHSCPKAEAPKFLARRLKSHGFAFNKCR